MVPIKPTHANMHRKGTKKFATTQNTLLSLWYASLMYMDLCDWHRCNVPTYAVSHLKGQASSRYPII
jgi:hypothetical protein